MDETFNVLDLLDYDPNYRDARQRKEDEAKPVTWGDYGRAAASGAAGAVGSVAGFTEYLTDADPGSPVGEVKRWGKEAAKGQIEAMSPAGQRAMQAEVLPGGDGPSIWDGTTSKTSALGLKATASLPGMLAAMIPGGLLASAFRGTVGAAAGMVGAGAVSGSQQGGDVFNDIQEGVLRLSDDDLQKRNSIYRDLRGQGYSEEDAKRQIVDTLAGHRPLIMAALGAAMEQFGAGAAVAKKGAGIATHGVASGALHAGREEAATEAFQNALQEVLTQQAGVQGGTQDGYDVRKGLNAVAEGALVGGLMGGVTGGVTGIGNAKPAQKGPVVIQGEGEVDADHSAAITQATAPAAAPTDTAPAPAPEAKPSPAPAATPDATNDIGAPTEATLQGQPVVAPGAARAKKVSKERSGKRRADPSAPVQAAPEMVGPVEDAVAAAVQQHTSPAAEEPQPPANVSGLSNEPATQEWARADISLPAPPDERGPAAPADLAPIEPAPDDSTAESPVGAVSARDEAPAPAIVPAELTVSREPVTESQAPAQAEPAAVTEPVTAPEPAPAPRVLRSQDERSQEAEAAWADQNRQVDRENLKAKGITPAKDGARTRDWKLLRPDVLEAEKTAKPFLRRAKQAIEEAGDSAPAYYRDAVSAEGDAKAKRAALDTARAAELQAALSQHGERQAVAEKAKSASDTGALDDLTGAVQTKREAEKLQTAAQKAELNDKAREAILSVPPRQELEQRAAKADPAGQRALKERLAAILFQARDAGIEIPEAVTKAMPPYLRELVNVKKAHEALEAKRFPPKRAEAFLADHYLAMSGATKESRSIREMDAAAASRREPVQDASLGARLGTGDEEAGPRRHAAEREGDASPEDLVAAKLDADKEDAGTLAADDTPEARERPAVKVDVARDVVAGANKAGTFKVESGKGRRRLMPIGEAIKQVNREPTPAQAKAGNYAKGHTEVAGLKITIENPKGSVRRGVDADGTPWKTTMPAHYGDVKGSKGADGDPIDVYVTPGAATKKDPKVFVVDQVDPKTGKFDEHKAVIGAPDEAAARAIYEKGFSDGSGKERIGGVTEMTAKEFQEFTKEPQTKPAAKAQARTDAKPQAPKDAISSEAMAARSPRKPLAEREGVTDRGNGQLPAARRDVAEAFKQLDALENAVRKENGKFPYREDLDKQIGRARKRWGALEDAIKAGDMVSLRWMIDRDASRRGYFGDGLDAHAMNAETPASVRDLVKDVANRQVQILDRVEAEMQAPAAMHGSRVDHLRDLELLAAVSDLEQALGGDLAPTVTSYGVEVPVRETRTLGDSLASNGFDSLKGINKVMSPFLAKRLRETVGSVPVHVVTKADMFRLTKRFIESGRMHDVPLGYYDSLAHQIVVREDASATQAARDHILLHEGLHAALKGTIETNRDLHDLIDAMRIHVEEALPGSIHYGLTNVHEFISEAFSNRAFQEALARIPTPPEFARAIDGSLGRPSTLWGTFIAMVRRFLGLPRGSESLLDSTIRVGEGAFRIRDADLRSQHAAAYAAEFGPEALMGRREVTDRVTDGARAVASTATRLRVRASTLDQIRQNYGGLFQGHLDRAVEAIQRISPYATKVREQGEQFSKRFIDLAREKPEVAKASAQLRIDATTAEVNLLNKVGATMEELLAANKHLGKDSMVDWQAKAQLMGLQKRFEALPADVRYDMLVESKWYGELQDRITKLVIENTLDTLEQKLSPADRDALVAKTMAGTLEDSDKALVGTTVFQTLKDARMLRSVNGMYFPLMRHGEFVVRTRDAVKVPAGAREISPGVVEWRGSSDDEKRLRAEAKRYAEGSELKVTGTKLVYYDPATGEQIRKIDATSLQSYDVAYRVTVQDKGVHFFDSAAEAERFRREEGGSYAEISKTLDREQFGGRSDLTGSQLASLINSVRQRQDVSEGTRKLMETAIYQASTRMMSGNRIQHRSLPRRYVEGASEDYARNALTHATAASGYLGKLTYLPTVRDAMSKMRAHAKDRIFDNQADARSQVLNELAARVDSNVTDAKEPSAVMRHALTITYMSKLFGPSHSTINSMQPWMVTYPVLAGRHGSAATTANLLRAYRDMGAHQTVGQGFRNTKEAVTGWGNAGLDTSDLTGSIKRNLARSADGAELGRVIDMLKDRGAYDDGANFEIAQSVARGDGLFGKVLSKTDRIARQLPGAVEAVNRTTTAVAAYRLGRRQGMSEAKARQYAFDTVMNTQGDYSNTNAPRFFNNPWLRPALQFKKYAQMVTYLWGDMASRAFTGASRQERMVALKQLGHLAAVQVAMAGALSLPGLEIVKLFSVGAAMMGIGGGYDDVERWLRGVAEDTLGKDWGEMVTKGIVSRAAGIDLSGRLSLADQWTSFEPKTYDNAGVAAWIGNQLIGAPGSTALDFAAALRHAGNGEFLDAAIKGVPIKFVSDFGKAIKGMDGERQLSGAEAVTTTLGFKPARVAREQQATGDAMADRQASQNKRRQLVKEYRAARTAGERAKLISQIREYNRGVGLRDRIFPKALDKYRPAA